MKTLMLTVAVVGAINAERTERGLPPLKPSAQLTRSAEAVARRGEFRHRRIPIRRRHVGEALAHNTGGPRATVRAWMASPPHRRLLLSRKFRLAGAGSAGRLRVLHLASRA